MSRRYAVNTTLALAAAGLAVAGGCTTDDQVRRNLTPELQTLTQRPADVKNGMALTSNENWRMFWEDLGRVWLFDKPSSLSPTPIPH